MKSKEIQSIKTTTMLRLPQSELTDYLDSVDGRYAQISREVYRVMLDPCFDGYFENDRELRAWMIKEYNITSRLAWTIVNDLRGKIASQEAQQRWLLNNLYAELWKLNDKIDETEEKVARLKEKARENAITEEELIRLRNSKQSLYWLKNKRNKKLQKIFWIRNHLDNKVPFRIGFGGRRMFKKQYSLRQAGYRNHEEWYRAYCFYRDHTIGALGSAAETSGNQLATLTLSKEDGTLNLRLRKFDASLRGKNRYVWAKNLKLNYLRDQVLAILKKEKRKPIYNRFVRSPKGWYLHISFDLDCPRVKKDAKYFCGLDYNDGFIEMAVSDQKGNLIHQEHIVLKYHGTGKRAEDEMYRVVKYITDKCKRNNWKLIIEDLDFEITKARTSPATTERGKAYNKMIHLFDYHRYMDFIERRCKKIGVWFDKVPAYYTSEDGYEKFGESKKLNRHQSACYYISLMR